MTNYDDCGNIEVMTNIKTINVIQDISGGSVTVYAFANTDDGMKAAKKCFRDLLKKHYVMYNSVKPTTRWLNKITEEGIHTDYDDRYSLNLVVSTKY